MSLLELERDHVALLGVIDLHIARRLLRAARKRHLAYAGDGHLAGVAREQMDHLAFAGQDRQPGLTAQTIEALQRPLYLRAAFRLYWLDQPRTQAPLPSMPGEWQPSQ